MKIVNLYVINGLFDSNGNYILEKDARTIIAECINNNLDQGCYYFAFLSLRHYDIKNKNDYSISFIEISSLLPFLNKNAGIKLQKLHLNENLIKEYEVYINQSYEAKNKVNKIDLLKYDMVEDKKI